MTASELVFQNALNAITYLLLIKIFSQFQRLLLITSVIAASSGKVSFIPGQFCATIV